MHPAGADAGACPSKGAHEGGQQQIPQLRQAVQQEQQNHAQDVPRAAEEDDVGAFMPVRSRRARRKQRQRLQESLEGPYLTSGAEAISATAAEVGMDERTALLQPVPGAESGCLVEDLVADAAFPNSEVIGESRSSESSSSAAVTDGSVLAARSSRSGEGGNLSGSSQHAEKNKLVAVAGGQAGNVRGLARGSTRGGSNTRGEKKQLYELRRLYVPAHRLTPLRKQWVMLIEPLVTHLQLQVRMNVRRRCVELRRSPSRNSGGSSSEKPEETSSLLQKGSDYVRAFLLGFAVRDALALLRLDDLSIESFEVRDVKRLGGEHLSRCLARLSGRDGKTKFAIENATRTRLVIADSKIHVLGSFENIRLARHACCSLILGAPPGKVYNHLRTVTRRLAERF